MFTMPSLRTSPRVVLAFVLAQAACIDAARKLPNADTTGDDTVAVDTSDMVEVDAVDTSETVDTVTDATDTVPGECEKNDDCTQPSARCVERVCESKRCILRPKTNDIPCDDGNPCTGDGVCTDGVCSAGPKSVDGRDCDNGLYCDGTASCFDGLCSIPVAVTCPPSTNPCAKSVRCNEEARACVEVPHADEHGCDGPNGAKWQCSSGRCVPPDMRFVPGGAFMMGCVTGFCSGDNAPAHRVQLSSFAIDEAEVTERGWRKCRDDEDKIGWACAARPDESTTAIAEQPLGNPVRWLDWERAVSVCRYEGKRLCTEAEWEYAARGRNASVFPWGNLPVSCVLATYFDESGPGCGTGGPSKVGLKPGGASWNGALDMAGNVAEWVADFYRADLYAERSGDSVVDPLQREPAAGLDAHVIRGGSFRDGNAPLRSFTRAFATTGAGTDAIGVRCCVSLDDATGVTPGDGGVGAP